MSYLTLYTFKVSIYGYLLHKNTLSMRCFGAMSVIYDKIGINVHNYLLLLFPSGISSPHALIYCAQCHTKKARHYETSIYKPVAWPDFRPHFIFFKGFVCVCGFCLYAVYNFFPWTTWDRWCYCKPKSILKCQKVHRALTHNGQPTQ